MSYIIAHIVFDDDDKLKSVDIVDKEHGLTIESELLKELISSKKNNFYIKIQYGDCDDLENVDCFISNNKSYKLDFENNIATSTSNESKSESNKSESNKSESESNKSESESNKSESESKQLSNILKSESLLNIEDKPQTKLDNFNKQIVDALKTVINSEPKIDNNLKSTTPMDLNKFKELIVTELLKVVAVEKSAEIPTEIP